MKFKHLLRRSSAQATLAIALLCLLAVGIFIGMRHLVIAVRTPTSSPSPIVPPLFPLLPPVPSIEVQQVQPGQTGTTAFVESQAGTLRVSNQSSHPVRVVLRRYTGDSDVPQEPIHWDFAPQEGRVRGMILSLPKEDLRLRPGDILVVFAQDGSRLYWGPYVVGETENPLWNQQEREWMLPIQPR
jgi:hypothetical protein